MSMPVEGAFGGWDRTLGHWWRDVDPGGRTCSGIHQGLKFYCEKTLEIKIFFNKKELEDNQNTLNNSKDFLTQFLQR